MWNWRYVQEHVCAIHDSMDILDAEGVVEAIEELRQNVSGSRFNPILLGLKERARNSYARATEGVPGANQVIGYQSAVRAIKEAIELVEPEP